MAEPAKKKPGRPRRVANTVVDRVRIASGPRVREASAELEFVVQIEYENPTMFKHIFTAFKHLGATEVHIRFEPDKMRMYCIDHTTVNEMLVTVYGNQMVYYYVESVYDITISPSEFQNILNSINVNHNLLEFTTRRAELNTKLTVSLLNDKNAMVSRYVTNIKRYDGKIWNTAVTSPTSGVYSLRFVLDCKVFKKCIASTDAITNVITIEKIGAGPLRFAFAYNTKNGDGVHIFSDFNLINLKSTMAESETLSVSVPLAYIKPISSLVLTDRIFLAVKNGSNVMSEFYLDQKNDVDGKPIDDSHSCLIRFFTKHE